MNRLLTTALALATLLPAQAQRDTLSLNFGWLFQHGDSAFTNKAERVDLPHDFLIGQPWIAPDKSERADNSDIAANVKSRLSARGFKEMGIGWYKKTITPDDSWRGKRVMLEFGGIMLVGDVYLNGKRIGGTEYGYVPFGIDISNDLKYGQQNTILVKADTRKESNSRWYTGAGLYREVKLITTPKTIYLDRHPLYITTTDNKTVHVKATIANHGKENNGRVTVRILDAQGTCVAESENDIKYQRRKKSNEYRLKDITLANAHLWDLDTPYLYSMEVTVSDTKGNVLDRVTEPFGVRTIEFGPQFGFKLNGKKVLLKGIANHHTLGALGAAAYPRAIEKRIQMLKQFGFNHIRCSHNPYSDDLYRLADKYGMLVIDEAYDKWTTQYGGGREPWINHWQYDVAEWVQRDRNHPSVVLWSLGNELQQEASLPFDDWGVTPYRLLKTLVNRYDSTRLTTVAMHPRFRNWETDSLPCDLAMATDIQAYNYRYMYFPGDGKRFPWMTFYQSEANLPDMGPNFYKMDLDKVVGLAYWGMIDYIGESRGWPAKGWADGVFDISLQPKPLAWFVKSMFTDEPTVRIGIVGEKDNGEEWNGVKFDGDQYIDHWNLPEGKTFTIRVFTNADEAELLLNGKSLGVKKNEKDNPKQRGKLTWKDVAYTPGTLEAVARKNGKVVARHKMETAGKAVALRLTPDNQTWKADGMDLQHVCVTAVDKKGRTVPSFNAEVTFTTDGDARIVAVDNGDMTNHEVNTLPHIHMHKGSALVILRAGQKASAVTLRAVADGLKAQSRMTTK